MRILTQNSIYSVTPAVNGFVVEREASAYGRRVLDSKAHFVTTLTITVGQPFVTKKLRTTPVKAVLLDS